jgi:hypothetical protein
MACTQTPSAAAALKCVRGSLEEGLALPHFKAAAGEGVWVQATCEELAAVHVGHVASRVKHWPRLLAKRALVEHAPLPESVSSWFAACSAFSGLPGVVRGGGLLRAVGPVRLDV